MRELYGDFGIDNPEEFYRCINRVETGFIRAEADELQYNLHIMLRFDLERSLITGDLKVRDIENAWNERFESDFGYKVEKPSLGVLQDVHWAAGAFGYFPTYTLGNIYAGCLYKKIREENGLTYFIKSNVDLYSTFGHIQFLMNVNYKNEAVKDFEFKNLKDNVDFQALVN